MVGNDARDGIGCAVLHNHQECVRRLMGCPMLLRTVKVR